MRFVPLFALLFSGAGCLCAQSADSSLRFDSVTITPGEAYLPYEVAAMPELDGCSGGHGTPDPGLLSCNVALATFLKRSYNLGPLQLTPPDWMQSSWWDIEAKVPAGATLDQVRAMARRLLADCFNLSAHFVRKEVVAYEMTVAKTGVKFKPWDFVVASTVPKGKHEGPWQASDLRVPKDHSSVEIYGANATCEGGRHIRGEYSMEELARWMSSELRQTVVDETGLSGFYDIMLDFAGPVSHGPECGTPLPAGVPQATVVSGAPIPERAHDQLGLVLELTKSTVDVLVIDHVEKKPAKNQ